MDTECIQDVYNPEAQFRLGNGSEDKGRIGESESAESAAPTHKRFVNLLLKKLMLTAKNATTMWTRNAL